MEQLALFEEQERTEHESFIAFEDWLAHLAFADLPAKEKVKRLQEAIVGRRSARKVNMPIFEGGSEQA